jgi:hypothetical protein
VANERHDYRALQAIPDPNNPSRSAYREGDGLYAQVVEDHGLEVGVDVEPARPESIPLPPGNASRAQMAKNGAIQGLDQDEADGMSRDQLRDHFTPDAEGEPDDEPDPADDAVKGD